jgi:hypothetical protein
VLEASRPGPGRLAGFVLLFLAVAAGLALFSAWPWAASPGDAALLKVAFKHVASPAAAGPALSREELERLPPHMRPQGGAAARTGRRRDTVVQVTLDGRRLLEATYRPGGLRHDGPTFVYEELPLPPGRHALEATLGETDAPRAGEPPPSPRQRLASEVEVRPGQVLVLELAGDGRLSLR